MLVGVVVFVAAAAVLLFLLLEFSAVLTEEGTVLNALNVGPLHVRAHAVVADVEDKDALGLAAQGTDIGGFIGEEVGPETPTGSGGMEALADM